MARGLCVPPGEGADVPPGKWLHFTWTDTAEQIPQSPFTLPTLVEYLYRKINLQLVLSSANSETGVNWFGLPQWRLKYFIKVMELEPIWPRSGCCRVRVSGITPGWQGDVDNELLTSCSLATQL
ncbi:hypothetical protein Zmor_010413 [Zophobas morio]|uniref:Uncharacterized protein n=1 Tax=Zophobas morio TaxID=2755281 RepID=A0AA38MJS5_9CUCU|nr:hypothetical protein Zmor_010413 [Zophobas morio]